MKPKTVLFLCTGNYYRSRFAELLFNHLARQRKLDWQAVSRALKLSSRNIGPISQDTLEALLEHGITLEEELRHPLALEEKDLPRASHIVAVKRDEHQPLLELRFPRWAHKVEFWQVHDKDLAPPQEALAQIHENVCELIQRLQAGGLLRRAI